MRFKVGDLVEIASVDPYYQTATPYQEYVKMIGTVAKVVDVTESDKEYRLDLPQYYWWKEDELRLAKSYIINQVLNEL